MPKLKPDTQRARRVHILDAAERCFAVSGFHRTTMQDICREAGISAGALYVYFSSKEDLIAGLCERDRAKLSTQLASLAEAPDLMAALAALGAHYAIEEPLHKRKLFVEIGAESTRNEAVGETFRSVDRFVLEAFESLFARAQAEGRIAPTVEPAILAQLVALMGDGMFWRRAVDPNFDAKTVLPALTALISTLVNPIPPTPDTAEAEEVDEVSS